MSEDVYKRAYEKGKRYLESIATSKYFDIVEDSYEYPYGLVLTEYASKAAKEGYEDGELSYVCINLEDYV